MEVAGSVVFFNPMKIGGGFEGAGWVIEAGIFVAAADAEKWFYFNFKKFKVKPWEESGWEGERPVVVANSLWAWARAKSGISLCKSDCVSVNTLGLLTPP